MKSPFRVAVINDEITQDFGRACEIVSHDFGMDWIELRGMWNKNLLKLDAKEIEEARRILKKPPACHRYRQSALQGGLARRAQVEVQPQARSIQG